MPAFLTGEFWNVGNAELWVGVGLVLFLAILAIAKVPGLIAGNLDARAAKIQTDLDEAARIRAEAEALLASLKAQRAEAEAQAATILQAAQADAERQAAEAKVKLDEQIERRRALAERKISQAEAQALAEVKAAAADLAVQGAEKVLAARLAAAGADPSIDTAVSQLAGKLQ